MKKLTIGVLFLMALFLPLDHVRSSEVFSDSFETKNFSATNADGFKWGETNYTSLITPYGRVYGSSPINPPDQLDQITPNHFEAYTGDVALRFRYNGNSTNIAEQRFDLGGAYRDLWLRYWIRVPINFTHPSGSPNNHKLLALWMGTYSGGNGPTAIWEFWNNGSGGSDLCWHYFNQVDSSHADCTPFISVPADRDRWMQLVFRVVASSSTTSNDGILQMWRRWEGESSFTQFHNKNNLNFGIGSGEPNGWHAGYLMGWSNATYTEDTQWLLDDFTVSTTSLLDVSDNSTPDTTPPTSPTNLAANATSSSNITVSWTAATDNIGVVRYDIERCLGLSCSNFAQVGTTSNSPFIDSGLTASTDYSYHVRAVDAAGNMSDWSNVVGATTQVPDTQAPTVPANFSATASSSSTINLSWTASTDNVGIANYQVERCQGTSCTTFTQIGTPSTTSYQNTSLSASTTYRYQVRAQDAAGNNSSYSDIATATTLDSSSSLPAPWQNEDIGSVGIAGSASVSNDIYTVNGAGSDIWGANDAFHFVYQPLQGDGSIVARVTNIANTNTWAKAGVMIRESTASGSRHATSLITAANGIVFQRRLTTDNLSTSTGGISVQAPYWLKLSRLGDTFTASQSANGTTWTLIGSDTIAMGENTLIGLAVTSHDTSIINTSVFDNVTITSTTSSSTFSSCSTVTPTNFTDPTYTGYGAPYDVFASNTPLISTQCSSTDTHTLTATLGIPGDTARIVYTKGYYYDPGINDWTSFTGTCTGALNGEWCQGSVSASVTNANISTASVSDPSYLVGFTCRSQNGSWKCGCRDTSCSNFYWQVQGAGR